MCILFELLNIWLHSIPTEEYAITLKHCAESSSSFHSKIKRIKQEMIIFIKMKGRDISIALSLA